MNQKFLIHAMGSGETGQAFAIGKYLHIHGKKVYISLKDKFTEKFFKSSEFAFPWELTPTVKSFKEYVLRSKPDTIIFCNSKSFKRNGNFVHLKHSPFQGIRIVTLDSNWLFNEKHTRFPYIRWADRYFVNIPKPIFLKGLKENGGNFDIPKKMLERIETIGFIPSYPKSSKQIIKSTRNSLGVSPKEKLIFCYFSGFGAVGRPWILTNLIKAIRLLKIEKKVKVICIGNTALLDPQLFETFPNIMHPFISNMDKYYKLIASSDLVFQHQGLSTLAQAISASVPVIANVRIYSKRDIYRLHPSEIEPFSKSNVCRMLFKSSPIERIAKQIHELLFDEKAIKRMRMAQNTYYSRGEQDLLDSLMNDRSGGAVVSVQVQGAGNDAH